MWKQALDVMDSFAGGLHGERGKSRTYEENRCYILALIASLRRKVDEDSAINWTEIEREVSRDFHVKQSYISDLRKGYMEDGGV